MTDFLNSRESIEVLEAVDATLLLSRENTEAIWQNPLIDLRLSRLSIEVLEGPVIAFEMWGAIHG